MPLGDMKLDAWFVYRDPTPVESLAFIEIARKARELVEVIDRHCPDSADKTAAARKIREAVWTACGAVTAKGI